MSTNYRWNASSLSVADTGWRPEMAFCGRPADRFYAFAMVTVTPCVCGTGRNFAWFRHRVSV